MVKLIDKYDFPGASLAVAFNGKLILARGYGYSKKSLVKKIPVNPNDRFRFASLSKPITATAMMLLVEEGKLSLDDNIIQLLQELGPQKLTDSRVENWGRLSETFMVTEGYKKNVEMFQRLVFTNDRSTLLTELKFRS